MTTGDITFGQWLQRRRAQLGLSFDELALGARCSAITLQKLESDKHRPSEELAHLLADCLSIPPEERPPFVLFARSDLPIPPAGDIDEDAPWRAYRPATNLPVQRTRFIGRERAVSTLTGLL